MGLNSSVGRGMGVEGCSAMVAGREVLEPGSWCVSGASMTRNLEQCLEEPEGC
jgi:hypothetical protein